MEFIVIVMEFLCYYVHWVYHFQFQMFQIIINYFTFGIDLVRRCPELINKFHLEKCQEHYYRVLNDLHQVTDTLDFESVGVTFKPSKLDCSF